MGTNAANLNIGRTVEITGRTATFSGSMPDNIGVGDVLQYQVTGTWHLAFIEGRSSDLVYTVGSSTGGSPRPAAAGTAASVFRAYTLLSNWQALDENDDHRGHGGGFRHLPRSCRRRDSMMAACYDDGVPMNDIGERDRLEHRAGPLRADLRAGRAATWSARRSATPAPRAPVSD